MESQVGQDKWVCEFFNYKRDGYFIDIGANDGIWLSNTYYMEKELGWSGICVEAGITPFNRLKLNRDCICVHALASKTNGITTFYEIRYGNRDRLEGMQVVNAVRLDTLMSMYDVPKTIDYVSIDTDGEDYNILATFPFDKHEVILWTLEHNNNQEIKKSMKELMNSKGYIIAVEDVKSGGYIFEDWYINKRYATI